MVLSSGYHSPCTIGLIAGPRVNASCPIRALAGGFESLLSHQLPGQREPLRASGLVSSGSRNTRVLFGCAMVCCHECHIGCHTGGRTFCFRSLAEAQSGNNLAQVDVAGSDPVSRSSGIDGSGRASQDSCLRMTPEGDPSRTSPVE